MGRGRTLRRGFLLVSPSFLLTQVQRLFHLLDCFTRIGQQVLRQELTGSRVIAFWRRLRRPLLLFSIIVLSSLRMIRS
jgi:hypothetical protein